MVFWIITMFVVIFVALVALLGLTIMLLWNWLMPTVFSLPQINFWTALGLFILSNLLIRGSSFDYSKVKFKK